MFVPVVCLAHSQCQPAPAKGSAAVKLFRPRLTVKYQDASRPQQRPGQHGIRDDVSCSVRAINIHHLRVVGSFSSTQSHTGCREAGIQGPPAHVVKAGSVGHQARQNLQGAAFELDHLVLCTGGGHVVVEAPLHSPSAMCVLIKPKALYQRAGCVSLVRTKSRA